MPGDATLLRPRSDQENLHRGCIISGEMIEALRHRLFSKWFFGLLAVVLLLDMVADIAEHFRPQHYQLLNTISLLFDVIGFALALWMFIDLNQRRPTHGDDPRRG